MDVVTPMAESLFNDDMKDLSMDFLEVGLDSITDNEILREIPIVKTVCAIRKTSIAIKEKFLLRKFFNFVKAFNNYGVEEEEISKRKNAIHNNEKWVYDEIEFLSVYLDDMDSVKKARILGRLYNEYLNRRINWERFCLFTEIVNRMFSYDMDMLLGFYDYSKPDSSKGLGFDLTSYNRLVGLGLIDREIDYGQDMSKYGRVFREKSYAYRITYAGKMIGEIIKQLK